MAARYTEPAFGRSAAMPKGGKGHKGKGGFVFELNAKCEGMVQAERCALPPPLRGAGVPIEGRGRANACTSRRERLHNH